MGMCLALCTLSDENIQKVLKHPPLIWKVIAPDDPEVYAEASREESDGFFTKLFGLKRQLQTEEVPHLEFAEDEVSDTDLDKAWHGIHYLLTQSAWERDGPLAFLVSGGSQVGELDVGYGPARALTSEQVRAVDEALQPVDEGFLKGRFKPGEMMDLEIYPEIWDPDPHADDAFRYCAEYFAELKSFVARAAQRKLGVVLYLS